VTGSESPYDVLLPDGQYRVGYVRTDRGSVYGSPRIFVWFKITEPGEFLGLPLIRFYNEPISVAEAIRRAVKAHLRRLRRR
jgi:hypothetical protein